MAGKHYDKKIFRLVFILNKIETERSARSSEFAKEFNVTIRSVQRDIETLILAGFPLESHEKGVYRFAEGFSLRKAALTGEQASLLAFLNEMTADLGPRFKDSFREILAKVLYQGGESPYYAKLPAGKTLDANSPALKPLERAIQEDRRIECHYDVQGKNKYFKVDPLKIAYYDGFWYLVCRVSNYDSILKLRVEKISDVKVLEEFFEPPANLKTMLDQSVNAWFMEGRSIKVVLKIDPGAAPYFRNRAYVPLQKITKTNQDGSLFVESRVGQSMEIIPAILRWIPHVTIQSPREIKLELRNLLSRYAHAL